MSGPCVVLGGSIPGVYNVRGLAEDRWPSPFPIVIHCNNRAEAQRLFILQNQFFRDATTDDPPARTVVRIVSRIMEARSVIQVQDILDAKCFYVVLYGRKTEIFFEWELIEPLTNGFPNGKYQSFKQLSNAIRFYCYKGKEILDVEDDVYWYSPAQLNGAENNQDEVTITTMTAQLTGLSIQGSSNPDDAGITLQDGDSQSGSRVHSDACNAAPVLASQSAVSPADTPNPSRLAAPERSPATLPVPVPVDLVEGDPPVPQSEWIYHVERGFTNVVRVHTGRHPNPRRLPPIESLGPYADYYIRTHGYDLESHLHIVHAYKNSTSREQFTSILALQGAIVSEMEFLYYLCTLSRPA